MSLQRRPGLLSPGHGGLALDEGVEGLEDQASGHRRARSVWSAGSGAVGGEGKSAVGPPGKSSTGAPRLAAVAVISIGSSGAPSGWLSVPRGYSGPSGGAIGLSAM